MATVTPRNPDRPRCPGVAHDRRTAVDVTVVDETFALAQLARRVFLALDMKPLFAASLQELPLVFGTGSVPELLIVNIVGKTTARHVARRLQELEYGGRVVAFVETLAEPGLHHLTQLPNTECIVRPRAEASLDEILRGAVRAPVGGNIGRVGTSGPPAFHGIV